MSIFGLALPPWANDLLDVVGRRLAFKAKVAEQKAEDRAALTADVAADNLRFAEEAAEREVATGKPRPK